MKSCARRACRRAAISVIEVLVAMVVAIIGVLGIMIMIPFSVGQVQTAFDYETANRLGRNAANEFKIKGFDDTRLWRRRLWAPPFWPVPAPLIAPVGGATARAYLIDPIGAAAREVANLSGSPQGTGHFPFVHRDLIQVMFPNLANALPGSTAVSADKSVLIERVSLARRIPIDLSEIMTPGLARWYFSWRHDLNLRAPTRDDITLALAQYPTVDLAPPQQIFDVNSNGVPVRRQTLSEMSYVILSIPTHVTPSPGVYPGDPIDPEFDCSDRVFGFRNFVLVYKQRPMPVHPVNPLALAPYDRMYEAIHPMGFTGSAQLRILTAGGTVQLYLLNPDFNEIDDSNALSTQRQDIRRGDWMALTNVVFDRRLNRFVQEIDFFQVLDSSLSVPLNLWTVTLQGPSFDFKMAERLDPVLGWLPDPTIPPDSFPHFAPRLVPGPPAVNLPSRTYAIHLPDVWAVIERTYETPE